MGAPGFTQIDGLWGIFSYHWGETVYSHACGGKYNVDLDYKCRVCKASAPQYVIDVWNLLLIKSGSPGKHNA